MGFTTKVFRPRVSLPRICVRDVLEFFHPPLTRTRKDSDDAILRVWRETAAPTRRAFEGLTLADLIAERSPASHSADCGLPRVRQSRQKGMSFET